MLAHFLWKSSWIEESYIKSSILVRFIWHKDGEQIGMKCVVSAEGWEWGKWGLNQDGGKTGEDETRASSAPAASPAPTARHFPGWPGYWEDKCHSMESVQPTKIPRGLEWVWMNFSLMVLKRRKRGHSYHLSTKSYISLSYSLQSNMFHFLFIT